MVIYFNIRTGNSFLNICEVCNWNEKLNFSSCMQSMYFLINFCGGLEGEGGCKSDTQCCFGLCGQKFYSSEFVNRFYDVIELNVYFYKLWCLGSSYSLFWKAALGTKGIQKFHVRLAFGRLDMPYLYDSWWMVCNICTFAVFQTSSLLYDKYSKYELSLTKECCLGFSTKSKVRYFNLRNK